MLIVLTSKLEELLEDNIKEIADFTDFLLSRRSSPSINRGSPEALLEHSGKIFFENGELEELLDDIKKAREMDLENI